MSLNYTQYVSQIANLMSVSATDTNFLTFLPGCIDYAEQRLYRELDLLSTRVVDSTTSFTPSNRNFTLPTTTGVFVVVEQINVITPVNVAAATGNRVPLTPVSKEVIDILYPSNTAGTGVPEFFAPVSNTGYLIAPPPDQAYVAEVIGTQRPAPLTSVNTTTFLTNYLPDLFIVASMVFASGYQRDFGAQSDDPSKAMSWESQYGKLMQTAEVEELRKKYQGPGWTPRQPSPIATPPQV